MNASKLDGSDARKFMSKKISIFNPIDYYMHWFIVKFTPIVKSARLTPKQLAKMIHRDDMIAQEKDWLIEMFYNRKAVLVSDFTEIEKVRK